MKHYCNLKYVVFFILFFGGCKSYQDYSHGIHRSFAIYVNGPYFIDKQITPTSTGSMYQKIYTMLLTFSNGDRPSDPLLYGFRMGECIKGKQEGLWVTRTNWYGDPQKASVSGLYIHREENFKNGLHHGKYVIYNEKGEILYATIFKDGTGVEKDFHPNGQLYYEIEKKDGYFTDTLKIYDDLGRLAEEFLYEKDSLVYHRKHHIPRRSRIKLEPPDVE